MKKCLEIFIITYNRAAALEKTLAYLANSALANCRITVLDNNSLDETSAICAFYSEKLSDFSYVTHVINIGAGANFLRAFEISNAKYTWVLCDDDFIDLSYFFDVEEVLLKGEVDLIHVGGHPQKEWIFGGKLVSAKKLYNQGYPYFKFSSFLPANIFKTDLFKKKFLIAGYNNVVNAYPHMPYLFNVYQSDNPIYISKKQIVVAKENGQSYDVSTWFYWWMRTCELLSDKNDVRNAYLDQWAEIGKLNIELSLNLFVNAKYDYGNVEYFSMFQQKYFNNNDLKIIKKYEKYRQTKIERLKSIMSEKIGLIKKIFSI